MTQTISTSVRVSLKDQSVEISGSEPFVHATLVDPKLIQNLIQVQVNEMDARAEKDEDILKDVQAHHDALMDAMKKYLERMNELQNNALGRL